MTSENAKRAARPKRRPAKVPKAQSTTAAPGDASAARAAIRAFIEFRTVVMRDPMRQTIRFLYGRNASLATIASLLELHQRGDQSVSHLAREIGLSVAATSQLVDRLVQDGLVTRTESMMDRRRKEVALTAAGRRMLSAMEGTYSEAAEQALRKVPAKVLHELEAALAAVIAHMPATG
jgi:DNA-binding MarR family transcriptional regulator